MSVNVYKWPPFQLTGWELAEHYPQSRSVGLIEGRPRTSSAQRGRRIATANVTGIGTDRAGAGYVRMLNRLWSGAPNLVRVECLSSLWYLSRAGLDLSNNVMEWVDDGTEMLWTIPTPNFLWVDSAYALFGEPVTENGLFGLTVTGLPPSRIIARPSELISVTDGNTNETAYVMRVTRSDADGVAVIRTDKAAAFTVSGLVRVGHKESVVFEAQGVPRSVQGVTGTFGYQWDFREVFADEYTGGFVEVDPWG